MLSTRGERFSTGKALILLYNDNLQDGFNFRDMKLSRSHAWFGAIKLHSLKLGRIFLYYYYYYLLILIFTAAPAAYGSSWARGYSGAAAAS